MQHRYSISQMQERLLAQPTRNTKLKIDIPLPCPKCGGKMYSFYYDSMLDLLKRRVWHVCKECKYERDAEQFKNSICCE